MAKLFGCQTPRVHLAPKVPKGGSSRGPEVVRFAEEGGLTLDPWQVDILNDGLAVDRKGMWLALEVAIIVARQNGKSADLAPLTSSAPILFGAEKVLFSAHEFKTAIEVYDMCCDLLLWGGTDPVKGWVENERCGIGFRVKTRRSGVETGFDVLVDGDRRTRRIRFMARTGGSGRGFAADLVAMDEAFSLRSHQIGALLPTLSSKPNPQVWYASSAPMHDSEYLHELQQRGRGGGKDLVYFEWSVERGTPLDDRQGWAQANPALGRRITERWIEKELEAMTAREFERERLSIEDEADGQTQVSLDRWLALVDEASEVDRPLGFSLDITPERDWSAISVAGVRADALAHVEIVDHLAGTEWVVERCVDLWGKWKTPFWIETSSPAAAYADTLEAKGVEVKLHPRAGGADPLLADAIKNSTLRHLGQGALTSALAGARRRVMGDTWVWSRATSSADICPLKAAALAHYGAMVEPPPPPKRRGRVL